MILNLSMSINITIGSSWEGSTPWKSSSENVIGGIIGRMATKFTWWTARRCLFRTLFELPPPPNPPAMVLMTSRPLLWSSLVVPVAFSVTIILLQPWRSAIPFSWCFFSAWGTPTSGVNARPKLALLSCPSRPDILRLNYRYSDDTDTSCYGWHHLYLRPF